MQKNFKIILSSIGIISSFIMLGLAIPYIDGIFNATGSEPPQKKQLDTTSLHFLEGTNYTRLDELYDFREWGGVGKDGIKSINIPTWIPVEEVDFMSKQDIVFGIDYQGEILAIPRKLLVHHEIMNIAINGTPISVTYCPLTGSTVGYHLTIGNYTTTLGISGELINSNLVMYDRLSDSFWPQIQGQAVSGPLKGYTLEKVQIIWTTWEKWVSTYPETLVQNLNSGYVRNYQADPYGSYYEQSYYTAEGPLFWTENWDQRLHDKDIIIGLESNFEYLAIEKKFLREEKVINTVLGNKSFVIFYDEGLDVAKVYESSFQNQTLLFSFDNGEFIDSVYNYIWNADGITNEGNLKPHVYMDSMWFGWSAFYPQTSLLMS